MTSRRFLSHHNPILRRITDALRSFSLYNTNWSSYFHSLYLLVPTPLRRFVSETLSLMDVSSLFFSDDGALDLFSASPLRDDETNLEKLYFVPFRWWNEACEALFADSSEVKGVYYSAESSIGPFGAGEIDFASEIVLNLCREDGCENGNGGEENDCALVAEWMFLRVAKWHTDVKKVRESLSTEDNMPDMFPLLIKLSISWCSSSLVVRICQQDNEAAFSKARNIFHVESGLQWGIWDFSGQTAQFLSRGKIKISDDLFNDEEIPLELQVYGSPDLWRRRIRGKYQMEAEQSLSGESFSSLKMNGSTDHISSSFSVDESPPCGSCYFEVGILGLTGLHNLGNTCFMNSAIQCLVHTPNLVDYFLGDYRKDINTENPLGMNGQLALRFGDLLRKLWAPGATPIAPRAFKSKLAAFAPQFSGYNQHDSQEFLAFLLDGLHEDLNRVKVKPYIESKDIEGCPDEEVADEYWLKHLARNDSIIVDLCQGQYQSTLVCPECKKLSIVFDPFMYLSLPLPSTTMRMMTLTVFSTDGNLLPSPVTITVPKYGKTKDLVQALSTACFLKDDETLLVAEIFDHRVLQFLDNPSDSIELLRDEDRLVAYRLPKSSERSCLVVFMHEHLEREYAGTQLFSKRFGIPLVACISDLSAGSEMVEGFLRLLSPFSMSVEYSLKDDDDDQFDSDRETDKEDLSSTKLPDGDLNFNVGSENSNSRLGFQFFLVEERGLKSKGLKIEMNKPIPVPPLTKMFNVIVCWPKEMMNHYDTCLLSNLPQICKPGILTKQPQEHISLDRCLEAFLKEELLGADDMWFCPNCKKHQQASKKLDIWRLPEILIIHLKRFSYSRFLKNKLETFVDFPVDDLDLSSYMSHMKAKVSQRYKLYAVSNHYGGLGGGHYTAFAQHGGGGWYEFDDSHVSNVKEDQIKTSAAYVLFYRRKEAAGV